MPCCCIQVQCVYYSRVMTHHLPALLQLLYQDINSKPVTHPDTSPAVQLSGDTRLMTPNIRITLSLHGSAQLDRVVLTGIWRRALAARATGVLHNPAPAAGKPHRRSGRTPPAHGPFARSAVRDTYHKLTTSRGSSGAIDWCRRRPVPALPSAALLPASQRSHGVPLPMARYGARVSD